jgi:hypothetical protein
MTNIAIENGPFIVDLPIKMVIFHSYVSLPEGIFCWLLVNLSIYSKKLKDWLISVYLSTWSGLKMKYLPCFSTVFPI